jgi:hypothetical protein
MSGTRAPPEGYSEPAMYEIRIKGHLDDRWAYKFEGLTLTREDNGVTLLTGTVADQAALHGVLRAIRNLGVPLLSVTHVQSEPAEAPDGRPQDTSHRSTKESQT